MQVFKKKNRVYNSPNIQGFSTSKGLEAFHMSSFFIQPNISSPIDPFPYFSSARIKNTVFSILQIFIHKSILITAVPKENSNTAKKQLPHCAWKTTIGRYDLVPFTVIIQVPGQPHCDPIRPVIIRVPGPPHYDPIRPCDQHLTYNVAGFLRPPFLLTGKRWRWQRRLVAG